MNQNLLFIAKAIGDLKVSINGEGCVGFSVKDVWTNFVTFELMGDQGNLFSITDNGNKPCALENLRVLLSLMKVVPHGNDQTNRQFVTDNVVAWLKEKAFVIIKEGFAQNPDVFKLTVPFKEQGRTVITLTVEIMTNKHVQAMLNLIECADFVNELTKVVSIKEKGAVRYMLQHKVNTFIVVGEPLLYKQFGVSDLAQARYHYCLNINPKDTSHPTHILTDNRFNFARPRASRALIV